MDIFSFGPVANILSAAYAAVHGIDLALAPLVGGFSAALAVVLLTLIVRTMLLPVGFSGVRAEFGRRRIAPHLAALRERHKADPARMQASMMELYRREKVSPFAGVFPLLLQAPVISIVYALFLHASIGGHLNALLTAHLAGVTLGTSFIHEISGAATLWPGSLVFVVVLALIATVAALSRRLLALPQPIAGPADARARSLAGALSFLPFLTVVFAAFVPLAAALYLLTTTAWTVAERVVLRRILDPDRHGGSQFSPP